MKRLLTAAAVLTFLAAAPLFALDTPDRNTRTERHDRTTVIDDVIRMSQAGVSDDAIIRFVREEREHFVVNADVIIALTNAKVSKPVLEAVMDAGYSPEARRDADRRTTVVVSPYVAYDPWFSPYYYDPFFSVRFGWGHYGHYGHRPYRRWHR